MAVLLGNYTIPLLGVSLFIATLIYITYKLLSDYLHKWFEMKPIPELEGTYPIIGNALMFKTNAGGKKAIDMLLQEASWAELCAHCQGIDHKAQWNSYCTPFYID